MKWKNTVQPDRQYDRYANAPARNVIVHCLSCPHEVFFRFFLVYLADRYIKKQDGNEFFNFAVCHNAILYSNAP